MGRIIDDLRASFADPDPRYCAIPSSKADLMQLALEGTALIESEEVNDMIIVARVLVQDLLEGGSIHPRSPSTRTVLLTQKLAIHHGIAINSSVIHEVTETFIDECRHLLRVVKKPQSIVLTIPHTTSLVQLFPGKHGEICKRLSEIPSEAGEASIEQWVERSVLTYILMDRPINPDSLPFDLLSWISLKVVSKEIAKALIRKTLRQCLISEWITDVEAPQQEHDVDDEDDN